MRIGKHDFEFKAKQAAKFLNQRHKVKVELILKGREFQHLDLAYQELETFHKLVGAEVEMEQRPQKLGNRIIMILAKA